MLFSSGLKSVFLSLQERKRLLEAERQARVEELLMKRKEQEARIEQQRQEKEKAREDAARERARYRDLLPHRTNGTARFCCRVHSTLPASPSPRDREERLAALSAAQQEAMEELQKKIQMKVCLHP